MHHNRMIDELKWRKSLFRSCFGVSGCLADPYSDRLLGILHEQNWPVALKLIRKGEGLRWSNFGWTVLHFAMWKKAPERVVVAMLRHGLSANERDYEDGKTAVHFAVQFNPPSLPFLLQHAGDSNFEDNQGVTPLALAAAKGHLDTLLLLLDAGGDVNRSSHDGTTPLMQAASAPNGGECVRLLLQRGARKEDVDESGRTALERAKQTGRACPLTLALLDTKVGVLIALCSVHIVAKTRNSRRVSLIHMLPIDVLKSLGVALG